MANYIVTGGAGFIGSRMAKRLVDQGHQVFVLDNLKTGFKRNVPQGAIFYEVDIADRVMLAELDFPPIQSIFHFAAQSSGEISFDDPAVDIDDNYKGTYELLRLGEKLGMKKFLFASSMSAYGNVPDEDSPIDENYPCNPVSYYGCNKLASEKLLKVFQHNSKIETISFRLFNVYGPGQNMNNSRQGMVSIYMSYVMRDEVIHVKGSLDRFRDFIYVEDVIDAFEKANEKQNLNGDVYNLSSGRATTVKELLAGILAAFGKEDFDANIRVEGSTYGDIKGCFAKSEKLQRDFQWSPKTTLEQGLLEMRDWVNEAKEWWQPTEVGVE